MKIDSVFYGGTVHTLAGKTAQAVAVSDGRIAAVGSTAELLAMAGESTRLHDLKGGCLLPGFYDSHCHLLLTGQMRRALDLRGAVSLEEIVERGRAYIAERALPRGAWVMGYGFDHNRFHTPCLPTRETADRISTEHPVLLDRVCGHVGALNSLGLQEVGFDESTEFTGGVLDKNPDGSLNGILREVALDTCKMRIPMPGVAQVKETLREIMAAVNAMGITSVQSDDLWGAPLDTLLRAFAELEREDACTVRVYEEVQAARMPQLREFLARGLRTGDGSDFFRIGNIKLIADGSLGARTAFLRAPYTDDPANTGVPVYTGEALAELVREAERSDMQVAFHAIGDGALEQCIAAVEQAQAGGEPGRLRHRMVHCQIGDPALYARMRAAGIGADIQPAFVYTDAALVAPRLGELRAKNSYAWKTLLDLGIPLGGGSDSPVESFCPLWGIYCAVTRREAAGAHPQGWHPEQKLSRAEAVRLYTLGSAWLAFEEDEKGSIEPGKLADFVLLDRDIFTVPEQEIPHLKVMQTVVGGKVCYTQH